MIRTLTAYPAYKDSGVSWLGEVPAHWEVRRLKRIARLNPSKSEVPCMMRDGRAVFLPMDRVGSDGRFDASEVRPISDLWNGFTYFRRGDVIVAKITPCFENGKGACLENLPTTFGFGSTEFHVIRPSKAIVSAYLYRVTTLSEFRRLGADEMTGAAGQQRVPVDFIANFPIPFPPLPEQTSIVRFLDYVDRRIRRVIRARQRRIKLLEEYKQALIHQAVTGRIDVRTGQPYPAYKDSGVEWLGKVPAHWEMVPNRALLKKCKKLVGSRHSEYQMLSLTKQGIIVRDLTMLKGKFSADLGTSQEVRPGDLVFCLFDIPETPRTVGLSPYFGMITGAYTIFEPLGRCRGEFIERFYIAMDDRKLLAPLYTGLRNTIPPSVFLQTKTPVPPLPEQTAIVEYLDAQTAKIDAAIAAARREMELLREYRERLVSDVVTGKVDVREVAARLPEEPPEEESEWMDTEEMAEVETADNDAASEALSEEEVEI